MKYDYQISSHKKKKFLKKFYIFIIIVLVFAALAAGLIRLDTYWQSRQNTLEQTTTQQTTAFYDTKSKIYRTQYFQFQTSNTWNEIPDETTESKYVYRNQRGNLIEEEIIIYANDIPSDLRATRVLPVTVSNNGQLIAGTVSKHCGETAKNQRSVPDKRITFEGVAILCDFHGGQYEVLAGLKGGGTKLTLSRPNNQPATYSIFYRDVKANPNPAQLYQVISSFQTR